MRWWDLVCVSTRGRSQFPSVLLQPLGHLSALESTSYDQSRIDYRKRLLQILLISQPIDSQTVESCPITDSGSTLTVRFGTATAAAFSVTYRNAFAAFYSIVTAGRAGTCPW